MPLRNRDLDLDKFFVNTKTREISKQDKIKHQALDKNIYYSPSGSPLISVHNTSLGSCYQDWVIPSASVFIDSEDQRLEPEVSLDNYQCLLFKKIKNTISDIFKKHDRVYLSYSGGIDSMVILAAVLSLGLIGRTTLVVFENQTQSAADCLHRDIERNTLVAQVCNHIKEMGGSIERRTIDQNDLIVATQHSVVEITCYVTYTLMASDTNRAWLFGHHGNQILLHKDVFLDEILYRCPEKKYLVNSAIQQDYFYTKNLKNYNIDKNLIPLHQRHLMLKPWARLDGHNGCRIYAPLGPDNETFDWCRSIDFKQVDPAVITNASVARWLIRHYNQDWLEQYITTESVSDMDVLGNIDLPFNCVRAEDTKIPTGLHHHADGVYWLEQELSAAQNSGKINLNTLVSLKNLQWLASL